MFDHRVMVEKSGSRVTVVGTGAIGSAVVRLLLGGGYDVTVWNRTAGRAAALVAEGAVRAGSVQEAVSSSPLVLMTLTDHAAVRQCLSQVDLPGQTVVGMYTGTAGDARQAAAQVDELGGRYLDAGVQASPEALGTDAATILYSGSRSAFDQHRAVFDLVSTPRFVGETPEAAAIWDLTLFGLWYDAQLGLLRALDTVRAAGIDMAEFGDTASIQLNHVITAIPATVAELREASYPAGPATLAEHLTVVDHLIDLRSGGHLGTGGLPDVAARIKALIADGHDAEGLTATVGPPSTRQP
ncbi:NAD(P)-dependent oxidoreductase [Actinophytocola sp. NPDC049390]|uniref:NAD(P)-dependent oxidoreductase n=1 Tax=Actinophytocola sp. NPDC049390 TaxID=3363894 RepID=UPI0037A76558